MAFGDLVQTTAKLSCNGGTSMAQAFPGATTVGNLLVVEVWAFGNIDWAPGDVTDSENNQYALATGTTGKPAIWYATATTTGTPTVTVDPLNQGSWFAQGSAQEYSASGAILDRAVTNNGSSTTPSTGTSAATTVNDALIIAVMDISSNQASITVDAVSPAFTERAETLSNAIMAGECDSRVVSAGGTQACSWTCATTGTWRACLAAFRNGSTGGTVPTRGFTFIG